MPSRHPYRPVHRAARSSRPWRRVLAGALAAVTIGSVLGSTHLAVADQVYPVPASGSYTITGAGFGHGNGMSQYGAKGAALRGVSAKAITDFYYPGTAYATLATKTNRVRLSAVDARPVAVTAAAGLVATDGAGKKWTLSPSGTTAWRFSWTAAKKQFALQRLVKGVYTTVYYAPGPLRVGGPSTITVQFGRSKGDCKGLTSVTYSGTLRTLFVDGNQRSAADLPMEYYLRGVVPSESPASWPAAALQAQAVAARSYAAFKQTASRWFDSYDTTQDQCWDGAAAHTSTTDAAVAATAGKIRTYGGKPAFAQFSSSNGGYLNAGSQPYLAAKADPYEKYSGNPNASWTKSVTTATLRSVSGLAKVTGVRVTGRDGRGQWGGRVTTIVVDGATSAGKAASTSFTGSRFRVALGLRSTYFTFGTPATSTGQGGSVAGAATPTLWRGASRTWSARGAKSVSGQSTATSRPLLVDTNGDGRTEYANFDPAGGRWTFQGGGTTSWGTRGDVPVAGDVNGDKKTDLAVFRPSTGKWYIRGAATVTLGRAGDVPFLRDVTGDGKADPMVYRPSNQTWYRVGAAAVRFGRRGDIPVPADYNGDRRTELAVYSPSTGLWTVRGSKPVAWGKRGDVPVPGDYDGDGKAEMMRFRPSVAGWYAPGKPSQVFGTPGNGAVPVAPLR